MVVATVVVVVAAAVVAAEDSKLRNFPLELDNPSSSFPQWEAAFFVDQHQQTQRPRVVVQTCKIGAVARTIVKIKRIPAIIAENRSEFRLDMKTGISVKHPISFERSSFKTPL